MISGLPAACAARKASRLLAIASSSAPAKAGTTGRAASRGSASAGSANSRRVTVIISSGEFLFKCAQSCSGGCHCRAKRNPPFLFALREGGFRFWVNQPCRRGLQLGGGPGQQLPVRSLFDPVHQDMEVRRVL